MSNAMGKERLSGGKPNCCSTPIAMGLSEGTDEFDAAITEAENNYDEAPLNVEDALAAVTTLDNAIFNFFMLNADGELEFPMTDLYVKNPTLRTNNEGWTYVPENAAAVVSSNIAEFFDKDYDMSQTVERYEQQYPYLRCRHPCGVYTRQSRHRWQCSQHSSGSLWR